MLINRGSNKKISIVIPCFNSSATINSTIKSILRSSFKNIEIIVVDDGSQENIYPILPHNNLIKYIKNEHQGLGLTRNSGVKYATGDYIFFLDSDDVIYKDSLCKLYSFAELNNLEVVSGLTIRNDIVNKKQSTWYSTIYYKDYINTISNRSNIYKDTLSTNKLYKKEIFEKYNIWFEKGLYEDIVFTAKLYEKINEIGIIKDKVYMWIVYGDNKTITSQKNLNNFAGRLEALEKAWNIVCGNRKIEIFSSFFNHHLLIYLREFDRFREEDKYRLFLLSKSFIQNKIKYSYPALLEDDILKRISKSLLDDKFDDFCLYSLYLSDEFNKRI